ncbi:hypothetical protein ACLB1R_04295 [Escherichia coli]
MEARIRCVTPVRPELAGIERFVNGDSLFNTGCCHLYSVVQFISSAHVGSLALSQLFLLLPISSRFTMALFHQAPARVQVPTWRHNAAADEQHQFLLLDASAFAAMDGSVLMAVIDK